MKRLYLGIGFLLFASPVFGQTAAERETLYWQSVECEDIGQVVLYLETYPNGRYAAEARACAEQRLLQTDRKVEDLYWRSVECSSRRHMQAYLESYPNGRYVAEAQACLAQQGDRVPPPPSPPILDHGAVAADRKREEYYIAAASSTSFGTPLRGQANYAFGWDTRGSHAAGQRAEAACRESGDLLCYTHAGGQSLQGGCVTVVRGEWIEQREGRAARTYALYAVGAGPDRDIAADWAASHCRGSILGGKRSGQVARWACRIERTVCSSDVQDGRLD